MKYSPLVLILFCTILCKNCSAQNKSDKSKVDKFEMLKEKFTPIDSFPVVGKRLPPGFGTVEISLEEATEFLNFKKDSLYYTEELYNHDTDTRTEGEKLNCFPVARFIYNCDEYTCLIYSAYNGLNDGSLDKTMLSVFDAQGNLLDSITLMTEMITYDGIPYNAFGLKNDSKLYTYTYDTYSEKGEEMPNTEIRCYEISKNGKFILTATDSLRLNFKDYSDPEITNWHPDDPMLKLLEY